MVSKSQVKLLKSLAQKKYRLKNRLFIVEGKKSIQEFLKSSFPLYRLFSMEESLGVPEEKLQWVSAEELRKISQLKSPQIMLAIFEIPYMEDQIGNGLVLALDGVRDPGNLGTIIRLCDWFGLEFLVCSPDTTDCYNPKVVQASMGSLARVRVLYRALPELLQEHQRLPVFGAFMEGENIYTSQVPGEGILVMGNEANGISTELSSLIQHRIAIPPFGKQAQTESLNVATATAVLLSEFRRRSLTEK